MEFNQIDLSLILEPNWNKPVKEYDRALDPLGMNRVNDRMIGELVQGFTALTSRVRYYSFYVWAIEQIRKNKLAKNFTEFKNAFYDLERLYMLASISHEELQPTDNHNDINGSATGRNMWNNNSSTIPLNFTYFGHRLGGYGQYYQGSIVNLGLVEQNDEDEFEKPSETGYLIIKEFDKLANDSKFLSYYKKSNISKKHLLEIGEKICLCKIKKQENSERNNLIDLLFGFIGEKNKYSILRQQSLGLILNTVKQIQNRKATQSQDFLDAMYFKQIKTEKTIVNISIPKKLEDISKKWKIVKAHDSYALASETVLQIFLEFLQNDIIKGKNIEEFYQKAVVNIDKELCEILEINKKFSKESIQNLVQTILKENNIHQTSDLIEQSKQYDTTISMSSKINEQKIIQNIEELLDLDYSDIPKTMANSILLVLLTGLRFISIINSDENSIKWLKRLEKQDTGVLEFTNFVLEQIKQNMSLADFVRNFIEKFVIIQAESIFKDKIRSSTNPKCWFHKEGAKYIKDRDYEAKHRSIRFPSAVSLLHDLDLLDSTEEFVKCTKHTQKILDNILA